MKQLLIVAILFAVAFATIEKDFANFQKKYNKNYKTQEEFNLRFQNFKDNILRAELLAEENVKTGGTATFGINKFSDISEKEFKNNYLMTEFDTEYKKNLPTKTDFSTVVTTDSCGNPDPTNWDWTNCGVVTDVRNQGACGCCWAFSAAETVESYFALAGNQLTELSVSQIVDCDRISPNNACKGGIPAYAYQWIQQTGGLETEQAYPYTAEGGEAGECNNGSTNYVATVNGYQNIQGETGLYQQASTSGPVSVCVDAATWQSYTGGIMTSCGDNIDHCVQLVGYANYGQGNGSYWVVRNQWGTDWGINGHIYIAIGSDVCAIGDQATIVNAQTA